MEDYNMPKESQTKIISNTREDLINLTSNEKKLKIILELGNDISNDNKMYYNQQIDAQSKLWLINEIVD